ncbi:MAG: toll/interleukin-1 receptor domain-containing protein [Candidatus Cloacimonetes bacterium]|nr:toll/interleukin-1 receptor domain-containing protein [Candidatus Cloacimonadota bacterium]
MHDVFISYASDEKETAEKTMKELELNDIKCWISYRDVEGGKSYAEEIPKAIRNCKVFILLLTKNSLKSDHIRTEVDEAYTNKKIIIPYKLEEIALDDEMRYWLARKQFIDATTICKLSELVSLVNKKVASQEIPISTESNESKEKKIVHKKREEPEDYDSNISITRMAKYNELLKLGYTAEKIASQLVKNDYINFNEIPDEVEGTASQWQQFIQDSSETSRFMLNFENEIVGDWQIVALKKDVFEKAKEGLLMEKDIDYEKIELIAFPDFYYGYILAISILPDYRNLDNYMKLTESFYGQIEEYAEKGVFFKEWCINVFSPEVENQMKRLGFSFLINHKSFGKIYHKAFIPIPQNQIIKKFPKLINLYKEAENEV